MKKRSLRFLPLALASVLAQKPAAGADVVAGAPRPAPAAAAGDWTLRLAAQGFEVDEAALRAAVARELARTELRPGTRPVEIQIEVASGGTLQVSYRNPAGTELSRSVVAPARADEVPEASALLVGNLARDEAGALLAQLQTTRTEAAAPPAPAPVADSAATAPRELPPILPLESLNLSVFHPLTLRDGTEHRHLACEIGLFYSRSAEISGLSLNLLGVTRVDGRAEGAQIGVLGYLHGGPGDGLRVGGMFGVSEGRFAGLSVASLATVHQGEHIGAELSTLTSIATGPVTGLQASALVSYAGSVTGLQVGDVASISRGPARGAQIAALSSIADGVQGLQVSVVNIGGSVSGAQIGLVNVADDVEGLQLGLVNVAQSVRGQSLGFVPYNREGGVKIATWYNSSEPFNLGVRFHAGALYAMPTFAFDPGSAVLATESGARYSPGWSLGFRLPLDRAFLDLDANYSQRARGWTSIDDNIDVRYRTLLGWQFMKGFAAFAGGGVRHHVITKGPEKNSLHPELSVGMELL